VGASRNPDLKLTIAPHAGLKTANSSSNLLQAFALIANGSLALD
jgi:hypothetical protein